MSAPTERDALREAVQLRGEDAASALIERDAARTRFALVEVRAKRAEAERDAARAEVARLKEAADAWQAVEAACWDVRCVAEPTPGGDDADVSWLVIEHHMSAPKEREVGYGKSPLAAVRAVLAGNPQP